MAIRAERKSKGRARACVHRIIRLLPGSEMTPGISAILQRSRQIVVVVDVAGRARHVGMAVLQRESGAAVIELGVQPGVERMAGFTSGWEIGRGVIRIRSFLEVRYVAGSASR